MREDSFDHSRNCSPECPKLALIIQSVVLEKETLNLRSVVLPWYLCPNFRLGKKWGFDPLPLSLKDLEKDINIDS